MINNALGMGIRGIQTGMQGMESAARQIARGGVDEPRAAVDGPRADIEATAENAGGLVAPIIDLKLYERSVEASAQVVKAADETLGTLLDIEA